MVNVYIVNKYWLIIVLSNNQFFNTYSEIYN